jgi:hypothetical protein
MEPTFPAVTREDLADFIEDAVTGTSDRAQWFRFIVNHYRDQAMEAARVECVRLIAIKAEGDPRRLDLDDIERLKAAAAILR